MTPAPTRAHTSPRFLVLPLQSSSFIILIVLFFFLASVSVCFPHFFRHLFNLPLPPRYFVKQIEKHTATCAIPLVSRSAGFTTNSRYYLPILEHGILTFGHTNRLRLVTKKNQSQTSTSWRSSRHRRNSWTNSWTLSILRRSLSSTKLVICCQICTLLPIFIPAKKSTFSHFLLFPRLARFIGDLFFYSLLFISVFSVARFVKFFAAFGFSKKLKNPAFLELHVFIVSCVAIQIAQSFKFFCPNSLFAQLFSLFLKIFSFLTFSFSVNIQKCPTSDWILLYFFAFAFSVAFLARKNSTQVQNSKLYGWNVELQNFSSTHVGQSGTERKLGSRCQRRHGDDAKQNNTWEYSVQTQLRRTWRYGEHKTKLILVKKVKNLILREKKWLRTKRKSEKCARINELCICRVKNWGFWKVEV